ncbi:MAG: hypothetical protein LBD30_08055, partial [Verrucomicrobiales bacterium]|nr:hypothetical protein [Verrucomicrobiales bacterium]
DRQRRDPALLRYTAADEIELRLFPLERQQTREVAIEFLYPQNAPVFIQLNGSDILPVKRESTPPLLVTKFSADRAMLLPNPRPYLSLMPPTSPMPTRQGYWHFIIERTAADADQTAAQLLEKIRAFIGGRELDCKVTLANYESRPLTMTPVPVAKLPEILTDAALKKFPARGGFLRDKALREELFAHEAAMRRDEPRTFLNYPLPVTVSGSGVSAGPAPALSRSAVIIGVGEKITVLNKYERAFIPADGELEFYHQSDPDHPPQFTRVPSDQIGLVENPAYQLGAQVFALQDELDRHPQRTEQLLPLLVKLSKQSGIMAPATAYIVVESGEQWKILSEKERQKLAANQSLELEADIVPEPAAWSLLVIGLGLTVSVSLFAPRKAS